jgi:hypothetical protein
LAVTVCVVLEHAGCAYERRGVQGGVQDKVSGQVVHWARVAIGVFDDRGIGAIIGPWILCDFMDRIYCCGLLVCDGGFFTEMEYARADWYDQV